MKLKTKVKSMLPCLPPKDQRIAWNLICKEDYQSFVELVSSDIIKCEREKLSITNEEELEKFEMHISDLRALELVVKSYIDEEDEFYNSLDTSARMNDVSFNESYNEYP